MGTDESGRDPVRDRILNAAGVVAVGEGIADGQPVLKIYFRDAESRELFDLSLVPAGVSVERVVAGRIDAQ